MVCEQGGREDLAGGRGSTPTHHRTLQEVMGRVPSMCRGIRGDGALRRAGGRLVGVLQAVHHHHRLRDSRKCRAWHTYNRHGMVELAPAAISLRPGDAVIPT